MDSSPGSSAEERALGGARLGGTCGGIDLPVTDRGTESGGGGGWRAEIIQVLRHEQNQAPGRKRG
jgi:hypothetical protein